MKRIKYYVATAGCIIIAVFCSFSVGCELKGNFFDKAVLKRCNLEFLQKPQNATNEVYSIEGNRYLYRCEIESKAVYEEYAQSILKGFIDNEYTFGYLEEIVYLGDMLTAFMHYRKIYPSTDIEDYSGCFGMQYVFYYTKKPLKKLKEKYGGRFMGHREIALYLEDPSQNGGKFYIGMSMYGNDSNSEWGNYIFEKES